jgi:hypothetical protein
MEEENTQVLKEETIMLELEEQFGFVLKWGGSF